jgi:hypothetical protein
MNVSVNIVTLQKNPIASVQINYNGEWIALMKMILVVIEYLKESGENGKRFCSSGFGFRKMETVTLMGWFF